MDCGITPIKSRKSGMTLSEVVIASVLGAISSDSDPPQRQMRTLVSRYGLHTTSTAQNNARRSAMMLVEIMIAIGIGSVVVAAVMGFNLFGAWNSAAMGNYTNLDHCSRNVLDWMPRDIRQADFLSDYPATSTFFQTTDRLP
jgi:Tfp pilus assembly protein PilW